MLRLGELTSLKIEDFYEQKSKNGKIEFSQTCKISVTCNLQSCESISFRRICNWKKYL